MECVEFLIHDCLITTFFSRFLKVNDLGIPRATLRIELPDGTAIEGRVFFHPVVSCHVMSCHVMLCHVSCHTFYFAVELQNYSKPFTLSLWWIVTRFEGGFNKHSESTLPF